VLGDGEKHLGPVFEIHGGGLDLVFPHHENEIASRAARARVRAALDAQRDPPLRRREDVEVARQRRHAADALDEWGPETLLMLFLGAHWRKPMDYTDETLARAKARADGFREVFRNPSEPGGSWDELVAALDDDFNTPEALAVMHEWRDHDLLRRGLDVFGLGSLAERRKRRRAGRAGAAARRCARRAATIDEADRLRQEIEAAGWEVRDVAGDSGYRLVPKR
jgi:cysteinyl-tRNA synthetase